MTSKAITDKERNEFFASYCKEGKNKSCVDCNAPNPQWATAYFGILFCLECSGVHRSLGTHLTFVRSITMDTWKQHEIAAMRAGGNAAMLEWWKEHGINAKASIRDKYNNAHTQAYRAKIKCAVEGREYVEQPVQSGSSSSLSGSGGGGNSNGNGSGSTKPSKSHSSSGGKKKSSKSSSSSSRKSPAAQPAVGQLFSFDDNPSALRSSGSGGAAAAAVAGDSDSDDSFESFVTAPSTSATRTVNAVPNYGDASRGGSGFDYSDPRLKQYEGRAALGSDEFSRPAGAPAQPAQPAPSDDIMAAFSLGWSKIAQVASSTKEKLVESTAELSKKVEQAQLGAKTSSFIQSLWSGDEPASREAEQGNPNNNANNGVPAVAAAASAPVAAPAARATPAAVKKNNAPAPKSPDGDDGWGAWDGSDANDDAQPAAADSWGAWGSTVTPAAAPVARTAPAKAAAPASAQLVDLSFNGPATSTAPAPATDSWGKEWEDFLAKK